MNLRVPVCAIALIAASGLAGTARADVITDWNTAALNAIRANRTAPPIASRALAILHVAIYDAVNGISRTHEAYMIRSEVPSSVSKEAAARTVLSALFPANTSAFEALHAGVLAAIPDGPQKHGGVAWGEAVATQILVFRANDQSGASVPRPQEAIRADADPSRVFPRRRLRPRSAGCTAASTSARQTSTVFRADC